MKRALVRRRRVVGAFALCVLGMAGCASTAPAPPGTVLADAALMQSVAPGVTTRAMLLAGFGPTSAIRFDSGYEVWRYLTPATAGNVGNVGHVGHVGNAGNIGEFVIVLDPRGVVAKTRSAPVVYQWQREKRGN